MSIPRSPSIDLIHPLIECGYNVPWLDKEAIFEPQQIIELNERSFTPWHRTAKKVCATCNSFIPVKTNSEKAYCSVVCRQLGKK
jgi:hypothetical protein